MSRRKSVLYPETVKGDCGCFGVVCEKILLVFWTGVEGIMRAVCAVVDGIKTCCKFFSKLS